MNTIGVQKENTAPYEVAALKENEPVTDASLSEWLEDYIDSTLLSAINDLARICTLLGEDRYTDCLMQVMMNSSEMSHAEIQDSIYSASYTTAFELLESFEVIPSESESLYELIRILSRILRLESSNESTALVDILSAEMDPIETFARCCEVVDTVSSESIIPRLESVSNGFIQKCLEIHQNKEVETKENVDYTELKKSLLLLQAALVDTPCWAISLLKSGMNAESLFKDYWAILQWKFDQETDDRVYAIQLLAVLLLGSDTRNQCYSYWREHSDQFLTDLSRIQKVDVVMAEFITQVKG